MHAGTILADSVYPDFFYEQKMKTSDEAVPSYFLHFLMSAFANYTSSFLVYRLYLNLLVYLSFL